MNDFDLMSELYPLMSELYPRYLQAFREKQDAYRPLLRPHADVLEIGSHLGGFLQAAEEWNWNVRGIDVGRDTTEFLKRRGFPIQRYALEEAPVRGKSLDAVFLWNCFEQLDDPRAALARARSFLKKDGLLVLRVPNAAHYRERQRERGAALGLAYSNLLGFPYLYGYTEEALHLLLRGSGFQPLVGFDADLLTLPFPDDRQQLWTEQRRIRQTTAQRSRQHTQTRGHLTGPWIEIVYRLT